MFCLTKNNKKKLIICFLLAPQFNSVWVTVSKVGGCDTFGRLKEFGSSQKMPFLKREDDCVLQLVYDLIQTGYVSPGHLQKGKEHQTSD